MLGKWPERIRWPRKITLFRFFLLVFVLLNAAAYRHAYVMTHYIRAASPARSAGIFSFLQQGETFLLGACVTKPESSRTPADLGLPFQVHHFRGESGINLEGWYIPHAHSRGLIVLFHGYASCKGRLLPEAAAFHALGYSTFLVDFRGSGGSSGLETTIGFDEADDVAQSVAYARALDSGSPLILYGQSMGSTAILRAIAVDGVCPSALIVECPFDRLISTIENRFSAISLPSFPWADMVVFWGGVQHGFSAFDHNPVDYATAVQCPTLFLQGADDPLVTVAQAKSIFANLPGEKEFKLFEGVGHVSYLAERPKEWLQDVSEFLAANQARGLTASPLSQKPLPRGRRLK